MRHIQASSKALIAKGVITTIALTLFIFSSPSYSQTELKLQEPLDQIDVPQTILSERTPGAEIYDRSSTTRHALEDLYTNQLILSKSLEKVENKLSYVDSLYSSVFTTISTILIGAAAIFAIGIWISARNSVKRNVTKIVETTFRSAVDSALAESYKEFSYTWYVFYENDFQDFLNRANDDPSASDVVRFRNMSQLVSSAVTVSEYGKNRLEKSKKTRLGRTTQMKSLAVELEQHWVYHRTADLLIKKKIGEYYGTEGAQIFSVYNYDQEILEVLKIADLLLENIENYRDLPDFQEVKWFDYKETACFCLAHLGKDDTEKERGKEGLRDLIRGKTPGRKFRRPSLEWRSKLFNEHNPAARLNLGLNSSVIQP